ncbi:MAG: HEPN domain-containing protein [Candidatus Omnitrophica bacterium]|nr:HEPN domain-containing protein [Candidatus Omnitrophota bacterium]
MADPKVVNEWLNKANEDFDFADANLREESAFYAQICFHFHQAAEKYFKAFIVAHDLEFEKIHNLISLLKICCKKEPALSPLLSACEFLNTSYIDTRYPVYWPTNYTEEKALEAREAAKKIGETIKESLKKVGYV